jgi:hypothetical protein
LLFVILFNAAQTGFDDSEEEYNKFSLMVRGFMATWDIMNGMNGFKPKTTSGVVFYYIFTTLTNIIMLNIIISFIYDSYEKVCDYVKEVNLVSRAEILYDFALLASFFRIAPPDEKLSHFYIFRNKA